MSGGRFNYADGNLKSEMFGWVDEPYDVMEDEEISELVWDMMSALQKRRNNNELLEAICRNART